MSRRLAEQLVKTGELNRQQVDEALQTQLMSGGTIGTCLLDLGYVKEETLLTTLAESMRVDPAPMAKLLKIDPETIGLLTPEQAQKHLAIPLERTDDTLLVAGVSPKRLGALKRITGCKIVAAVAPEVRIFEALEHYYGVKLSPRYARLIKDLERRSRDRRKVDQRKVKRKPDSSIPVPDVDSASIDTAKQFGYGRDWRTVAAELEESLESPAAISATSSRNPPQSLAAALDRICAANFKEEIFEALLDYMSQRMSRCILFGVRSQLAHVWGYRGAGLDAHKTAALRVPIGGGSIFGLLLGNPSYRGSLGEDGGSKRFYEMLQVEPPGEVMLHPIYVGDRLIAILYGDRGEQVIEDKDFESLKLLAQKLSLAFNLLILKNKIRMIDAVVEQTSS